jgi:putative integral membrane protein (TIGR02587 family)
MPSGFRASRDLGRAAGGALVFALPMLMTMELWWLGFYLDRFRLLVLLAIAVPFLVVLSRHIGFEKTRRWTDDVLDAFIALGVSGIVCPVLLVLFGTITLETPVNEAIGKITVQIVPAAIGALLAKSQFGGERNQGDGPREETYAGELFLMATGALFLGFNVAPTEEMMLISYQMTHWHAVSLLILSLLLMHGFVFALGFAGGTDLSPHDGWWSPVLRFTLPGYVIALSISCFLLWVFARTDGHDADAIVMATVVLGFPTALGAAAARLIL